MMMLTTARPNSAQVGQMRFDQVMGELEMWDGLAWLRVSAASARGPKQPPWPAMCWQCRDFRFDHDVLFHDTHAVRDISAEVILWAYLNCRGLFVYFDHQMHEPDNDFEVVMVKGQLVTPRMGWQWSFTDPDDALHFKLRWY